MRRFRVFFDASRLPKAARSVYISAHTFSAPWSLMVFVDLWWFWVSFTVEYWTKQQLKDVKGTWRR